MVHQPLADTQVRTEAYHALEAYSMGVLEEIGAQRPLHDYAGLLLSEPDPSARQAAEALVERALAYEHATRRRCCCRPSSCRLRYRLLRKGGMMEGTFI